MKPLRPQSNDYPRRGRVAAAALLVLLALGLGLAVGCSPLRLLRPNQRLLARVTVESRGITPAQQERLATLVQQKPNRNLPLPKLAIYQFGHAFYDSARIVQHIADIREKYTAKLADAAGDSARRRHLVARRDRRLERKRTVLEKGNTIMRLGEPPVIYDPMLSARTIEQFNTYLHSQGYFRSHASYTDTARAGRSPGGILRHVLGTRPSQATPLRDSAGRRLYRRVAVAYEVQPGPEFTLGQLSRVVPDSAVARIIRKGQDATLLHTGEPYNEEVIGLERQRLETLLKNAGYYDFRAQLVSFEADTSFEKQQVRLRLLVANPPGGLRPYRLRQVTLLTDVGRNRALRTLARDTAQLPRRRGPRGTAPADTAAARVATNANRTGRISTANLPAGITPAAVSDSMTASRLRREGRRLAPRDTVRQDSILITSRGPLEINPKLLARQVTLRPNQLFNLTRTQRTQRLLSALDMFQFNTVSYRKVTEGDSRLSYDTVARDTAEAASGADTLRTALARASGAPVPLGYLDAIITTSSSPRFSETTEFGGTYVAGRLGPFGNLRLKWRNPFGGAEVLELGARVSVEGQLAQLSNQGISAYYTLQYGASAALVVPKFLVPFRAGSLLRNAQPRTRFTLSTTYTRTPYYTRSNTEATFDYLWQPSAYQQFIFTPVDIGIVNAFGIDQTYRDLLEYYRVTLGSPLYQSFRSIYEPSFSFTSIYNSNDINQTRSAQFLRLFVEFGGLTRGLYRNQEWFTNRGLAVYNFYRITADYRRYYKLTPNTYLAWRLNGGVARAITPTPPVQEGDSRFIIPYDKFLFAGGSNSVRAWSPRRLGIGSFATQRINPVTGQPERDYITEQPGNVLLEGSVEYRFPLYSFIRGALFTDFGNVWSLQPDDRRDGRDGNGDARFFFNKFYKQFAVASGFGLRMDFTFIILRFDIATKVYDPTEGEHPWVLKRALQQTSNQTVINVGLGYPF